MRGGLSLPMRRLSGTWESETAMQTEKPVVLVAWAALHFKARRKENILQEEFGAKFHQLSG